VIAIRDASGAAQDVVAWYHQSNAYSGYTADVVQVQADGTWKPADCAGATCVDGTVGTVSVNNVSGANGIGNSATGNSVRRTSGSDTDTAADWAIGTPSFGTANY
jgi:hypothetical protein